MIVRTQQDDTVDALCWRHYGRTRDVVEAVLALNAGLADLGPLLPMGIAVEMPDVAAAPATQPLLRLFD